MLSTLAIILYVLFQVFIGIPVIVLLASIYLVIAPFSEEPLNSLYCLIFIILGIPMYFVFVKFDILPKGFLEFIGNYIPFLIKAYNYSISLEAFCYLSLRNRQKFWNFFPENVSSPRDFRFKLSYGLKEFSIMPV